MTIVFASDDAISCKIKDEYLFVFVNKKGLIASIDINGLVEIHQDGGNREAAEVFYNAITYMMKNQISLDLESELKNNPTNIIGFDKNFRGE